MFAFRGNSQAPLLPEGFILVTDQPPSSQELNKLLSKCNEKTHPPSRLDLALKNSFCNLSILEESKGNLAGFIRATSDNGLNANLWNLVAKPGNQQESLTLVLIHRILLILRRDMPGCSISVSAPSFAITALQEQGFLLDPNGIRAMGYRLR